MSIKTILSCFRFSFVSLKSDICFFFHPQYFHPSSHRPQPSRFHASTLPSSTKGILQFYICVHRANIWALFWWGDRMEEGGDVLSVCFGFFPSEHFWFCPPRRSLWSLFPYFLIFMYFPNWFERGQGRASTRRFQHSTAPQLWSKVQTVPSLYEKEVCKLARERKRTSEQWRQKEFPFWKSNV